MRNGDDFDDPLDDILNAPGAPVAPRPAINRAPADFQGRVERAIETEKFTERCPACGGSGVWRGSRFGRGQCFKCKGEGVLTFRTSQQQRAKGRARAADKREAKAEAAAQWRVEHKAEIDWLQANAPRDAARGYPFLQNMLEAIERWGQLTDGQLQAVQKNMARQAAARAAGAVKRSTLLDAGPIQAAFATARARAARPGMAGV